LQRGTKDVAARLFRHVTAECEKNTHLWAHASAELKSLGAQP